MTLAPAARENTWAVEYRWGHWLAFALWVIAFGMAHHQFIRHMPDANPYLLPVAALLTGWGVLSIWRLSPEFGLRQAVWMVVGVGALVVGMRFPRNLELLYRYKYIFLFCGLFLTALTLVLGSNPGGVGLRLWLGCCGLYLQPSEPLKLLLIVYLAAYFADRLPMRSRFFRLIFPTLVLTGLAIAILLIQRDLGTASIFIFLYAAMLYFASGKKRLLLATLGLLVVATLVGYSFVNIIHARLESWVNPWEDPSGRSYQIIQSLMAVANGGLPGRGPGMGSPGLVPVAQSDFIFTTISEEHGLVGIIGLFTLIAIMTGCGFLTAVKASNNFRRLLAAGLTTHLGAQSVLIIGGNLRLLPLTGVTLPFVAYGGSSLLTCFIALLILLQISNETEKEPAPLLEPQPYRLMAGLIWSGLLACALLTGWWTEIRRDALLNRTDNARRAISDRYVKRGALLDRNNDPINLTTGKSGSYIRTYRVPNLASISGYTHPVYGQTGLEESLDPYLRGMRGNPDLLIWWNHLLYGHPPPGLDVRTSLDLGIQAEADRLLGERTGAVVLLNAGNGEILVMASHPSYDPNQLDTIGADLAVDSRAPLLNRATQGQYPVESALTPFLDTQLARASLTDLFESLGFYEAPIAHIPATAPALEGTVENLRVSPLQMALATATLINNGVRPAPRLALAVNTQAQGWVIFSPTGSQEVVLNPRATEKVISARAIAGKPFWEHSGIQQGEGYAVSWYLAGTLQNWQGTPLAVVVVLEEENGEQARRIGRGVLERAIGP